MLYPDWNKIALCRWPINVDEQGGYQHYDSTTQVVNQLVGQQTYKQLVVKYYSTRVVINDVEIARRIATIISNQTHCQFNKHIFN